MPFFVFELEFTGLPLGVRVDGRIVTIGRSKSEDLVLPDPSVEPHHATLRKRGKDYLVTSEANESGTFLLSASGEAVALGENVPRVVSDGARLAFGDVTVRVHLAEPNEEVEWIEASKVPRELVARSLAHYGHPAEKKDVDAALRELLGARSKAPKKRKERTKKPRVEEPTRDPFRILLVALAVAVVLAALALYWLLLPETPRSL